MPEMVGYLLLFTGVGIAFVLVNLSVGKLIRPANMDAEKGTIYECGEPTIGSAWVQFDLRFYVVALLFVIFDVEMAFFFPWAVVFGRANQLADTRLARAERAEITKNFVFPTPNMTASGQAAQFQRFAGLMTVNAADATRQDIDALLSEGNRTGNLEQDRERLRRAVSDAVDTNQHAAAELARVAFFDILFFFGVLLVGFAYLWKRGDLNWVRSMAAQLADRPAPTEPARPREQLVLVTKD